MIDYDSWVDMVKAEGVRKSIARLFETDTTLDCLVSWYYADTANYVHAMALITGDSVRVLVRGNGALVPTQRETRLKMAELRTELEALRVWTRQTYKIGGSTRPAFVTVADKTRTNDFEIARADFAPTIEGQRDRQLWALLDGRLLGDLRKTMGGATSTDPTRDRRKRLFAQESRKSLHLVWQALGELGQQGQYSTNRRPVLDMLTGIEALKNNARGLGYNTLIDTSLKIESVLHDIRDGKIRTSPPTLLKLNQLMQELEQQTGEAIKAD